MDPVKELQFRTLRTYMRMPKITKTTCWGCSVVRQVYASTYDYCVVPAIL